MTSRICFLAAILGFGTDLARAAAEPAAKLSLQDARKIAIQNHPRLQVAADLAAVAKAQLQETRSAYYPVAAGNLTGAEAIAQSRIAAGGLNNPIVFDRLAVGLVVDFLITDFGRTFELVRSSRLHAEAQAATVVTTRADLLLQVELAFYGVLKTEAVRQVAAQTVRSRRLVAEQISTMAEGKLKSGLDVAFANVNLSQAELLLVEAENAVAASHAALANALGLSERRTFTLVEEALSPAPPSDVVGVLDRALQNRPELSALRLEVNAAQSFAKAERDLWFPSVSAIGAAGLIPYRESELDSRYAAAGFNVNIPIFNGFLFNARRAAAVERARAQEQILRDTQNNIVRDAQKAWLDATSGYQRLSVTEQLVEEASKALDLARERYQMGLGSIVELSQAELNETEAEIARTNARYDYQGQFAALNYQMGLLR
ncbi:MAG: TolC family protein [Polyangia bacterium]